MSTLFSARRFIVTENGRSMDKHGHGKETYQIFGVSKLREILRSPRFPKRAHYRMLVMGKQGNLTTYPLTRSGIQLFGTHEGMGGKRIHRLELLATSNSENSTFTTRHVSAMRRKLGQLIPVATGDRALAFRSVFDQLVVRVILENGEVYVCTPADLLGFSTYSYKHLTSFVIG